MWHWSITLLETITKANEWTRVEGGATMATYALWTPKQKYALCETSAFCIAIVGNDFIFLHTFVVH